MKYITKPIVKEAMKLTRNHADQIFDWIGKENLRLSNNGEFSEDSCYCEIVTLEGIMTAREGDYIIKEINGEFYPCKEEIFLKTYDKVLG